MCYEEFKMEMLNTLKDYLPQEFQSWHLVISTMPEVSGLIDVVSLVTEQKVTASPDLHIDKFYKLHQSGFDTESAIRDAAAEFLMEMEYLEDVKPDYQIQFSEDRIIYTLVNTERNSHMLETIPHREILDLSVIYQLITETSDHGFNCTLITNQMAESFELEETELFRLAEENTPEWMPLEIFYAGNGIHFVGNTRHRMGAAAMIYDNALEILADDLKSDLYVLPASIHEIFAVRADMAKPEVMRKVVRNANRTVVEKDEFLSDQVYLYHRKECCLELLEE